MCLFSKKKDINPKTSTSIPMAPSTHSLEDKRQFALNCQIHGQFSDNVNAHTSSFITFVVSLLALFGAFGYVYANTINVFRIGFGFWPELTPSAEVLLNQSFTMNSFLLLSVVVSVMLCFIACLCIYLGYAERRDQVEQWLVRKKYGVDTAYSDPTDRCWCNYLSEYYRMFYHLLLLLQVLVIVVCVSRTVPFLQLPCTCPNAVMLIIVTSVVQIVCIAVCLFTKYHYLGRYNETVERCNRCFKEDGVVLKSMRQ